MTREETSKYTESIKGGKTPYPVRITKGWIEIRGIAWSGRGKITKVEISTDAGKHWAPALLQMPVLDKAHTYFRYIWKWNGEPTEIRSRAVDDTGYVQPTLDR